MTQRLPLIPDNYRWRVIRSRGNIAEHLDVRLEKAASWLDRLLLASKWSLVERKTSEVWDAPYRSGDDFQSVEEAIYQTAVQIYNQIFKGGREEICYPPAKYLAVDISRHSD